MANEQSNIRERQHVSIKTPRKYIVYIHNDDFTTMEFVVFILTSIFHKSLAEAEQLMLQVHHSDKAAVGAYSYDIAHTKATRAIEIARSKGFPLQLTVEAE